MGGGGGVWGVWGVGVGVVVGGVGWVRRIEASVYGFKEVAKLDYTPTTPSLERCNINKPLVCGHRTSISTFNSFIWVYILTRYHPK